jgi:carbamoylphosphate synthase small subunit
VNGAELSFVDEDGEVVDLVAVERAIAGDQTVALRKADKREIVRRMRSRGQSHSQMARASRWSDREVKRKVKRAEGRT